MQIIRDTSAINPEPSVATIGFFDGVHAGHRYLIQQVKEIAAAKGLRSALVTFPVHPRKVMNVEYRPELLTTPEEKISLLADIGVDYCLMLDFTPEISRLTAREFMTQLLKERYQVKYLVIGYDHRFGHNRRFRGLCTLWKRNWHRSNSRQSVYQQYRNRERTQHSGELFPDPQTSS